MFSLRNDIIESGKYSGSNVGNGTPFYKDELVLLECTYDYYKNKVIGITVTDIYDFNNGDTPTEFLYDMTSGYPELIE